MVFWLALVNTLGFSYDFFISTLIREFNIILAPISVLVKPAGRGGQSRMYPSFTDEQTPNLPPGLQTSSAAGR
jgi:hypothetical protein